MSYKFNWTSLGAALVCHALTSSAERNTGSEALHNFFLDVVHQIEAQYKKETGEDLPR